MSGRLDLPQSHPARRATANPAAIPRVSFIIASIPSLTALGSKEARKRII